MFPVFVFKFINVLCSAYITWYSPVSPFRAFPSSNHILADVVTPQPLDRFVPHQVLWNLTLVCRALLGILVWAFYQIRKIAGAHAPGMPGTFSPPPRVSDPDMRHGTCVTHVPWCMPASLTSGFLWSGPRGKTFPAFPAHAQLAILRIW